MHHPLSLVIFLPRQQQCNDPEGLRNALNHALPWDSLLKLFLR